MTTNKKQKDKIMKNLLEAAAFDGWNDETIRKAAVSSGLKEKDALINFPGGISEAVDYFFATSNEQMLKKLKDKLGKMRIRDKIATAVMTRLDLHKDHKESMRKLALYYAMPQNSFQGMRHMAKMASLMWYEAGDNSTDFNYYTKRGLLAGVFTATSIYWLNDDSKNHERTKKFLHNRIEDVMKIQKFRAQAEGFIEKIPFVRKMFS